MYWQYYNHIWRLTLLLSQMQRFPVIIAMVILLMFSISCASGDKYIGGCYRKRMGCFNEPCKRRCRLLYGLDGYCKRTELCPKRRYRCKCTYRTPDHDTDDWAIKWIIWLSKTIGWTQLITRRNELKGFIGSSEKVVQISTYYLILYSYMFCMGTIWSLYGQFW